MHSKPGQNKSEDHQTEEAGRSRKCTGPAVHGPPQPHHSDEQLYRAQPGDQSHTPHPSQQIERRAPGSREASDRGYRNHATRVSSEMSHVRDGEAKKRRQDTAETESRKSQK